MRVCQPVPVARNAANTSGSNRTVVDTLVGLFCIPRPFKPFKVVCNDSGSEENGTALLKSTWVSSRTSPFVSVIGDGFAMFSRLSGIGFAETDDTDTVRDLYKA